MTQAKELQEQMNNPQVFGPDSVFLSMKGQCYEAEDSGQNNCQRKDLFILFRFEYSVCWFEEAKQSRKNGVHGLNIGKWKGWAEKTDTDGNQIKDFKHMIYDEGDWCGSKARETHVYLKCGWNERITTVDEPSTCVYNIGFTTPLACIL